MLNRSWIAALLLINYLLVVGMGCVSSPEAQSSFVLVQTVDASQQYEPCRYLRMDGLEAFLAEALTNRYEGTANGPKHHLISVVSGIDTHCLPFLTRLLPALVYHQRMPIVRFQAMSPVEKSRTIESPPWRS